MEGGREVVGNQDPQRIQSGDLASVPAPQRIPGLTQSSNQFVLAAFRNQPDQRRAHPSARSEDRHPSH
jgi:hypothetical protein